MPYILTTKFPKLEEKDATKETVANRTETLYDLDTDAIMDLYQRYLEQGYEVSVNFKSDDVVDDFDVFAAAEALEKNGLDYSAKLKFLNKTDQGSYDEVHKIAQIIEQKGFDFTVAIKLKINGKSPVDFDKESTWFAAGDAIYKVTPKASTKEILELKPLYDTLQDVAQVMIELKPKKPQEETLALCIDTYPSDTEVIFTLKDAAY